MKLFSFRIQNYKSIMDSGVCYIEEKITIFAGKNGSGKSNILEALSKFSNFDFNFEDDNYIYEKDKPIITVTYKLDENETLHINKNYKVNVIEYVTIILDTNNNDDFKYEVCFESDIDNIRETNSKIIDKVENEIQIQNLIYADTTDEVIQNIDEEIQPTILQSLKTKGFVDVEELKKNINEYIINNLPCFVYKKTVVNELSSIITLDSIRNNDFHKDIFKLLKLSEEDFNPSKDKSARKRTCNRLSQELTGNFGDFYKQDRIQLQFSFDSDSLVMDVTEPDKASKLENKIENKSDGLRWFIAFYTKLNVIKNKKVIILLDEPGMYLHAKACREMLQIFDNISNESQILLATHNPYLIDAQKLGTVRLVLNETDSSTVIENKPHRYRQDLNMDALTPILTSIGYELTMSIHVGDQKNNLITEGISDYYFLHGMARILNKKLNYLIIPSSSADKINYIASILIGWGLNTIVLLDSDKKGKKKEEELSPLVDKCVFVDKTDNQSIEDLFTKEEYCKQILGLDEVYETQNSKTKKDLKIDEVLKAKQFCENAESNRIVLSEETKNKFTMLFNQIEIEFGNINK